jgi:hypothetical protein
LITENQIKSGSLGVVTSGTSQPDIGHYPSTGDNTIALNDYQVYNDGAYTVYAQDNCWGNNTPPCMPSQGQMYGSVITTNADCCTVGEGLIFAAEDKPVLPRKTSLGSIVPNPFNPATSISYDIASPGVVEIRAYDVAGRLVRELVKENKTPGRYQVIWNGLNSRGESVASGIYFVRMIAAGERLTKKMVLIK